MHCASIFTDVVKTDADRGLRMTLSPDAYGNIILIALTVCWLLIVSGLYIGSRRSKRQGTHVPVHDLLNNRRRVYVEEAHVHGDTSAWRGE